MNGKLSPSLKRLAAANPVAIDERLGRSPGAQAQLARILATERDAPRGRWRMPRRRVVGVLIAATVLAGCGAVLRATDPFGFWRSSTPGTALFAVDPALHATAPKASEIGCRLTGGVTLACSAAAGGIRYRLIDRTFSPVTGGTLIARSSLLRIIDSGVAHRQLSATAARRLRLDIAAVPDAFFTALREMERFQSMQSGASAANGKALVPPADVPVLIVCQQQHAAIGCRNLNGDEQAPIGAGIYGAEPAADWVTNASTSVDTPQGTGERMVVAILGHPFTAAEVRLLVDLARQARPVTTHSRGGRPVIRGQSAQSVTRSSS